MGNLHDKIAQHGCHASVNGDEDEKAINILLVEDSYGDTLLMLTALNSVNLPYTLDRIDNGDDVLPYLEKAAQEKRPDVIFLDMELPGTDGFEILQTLASGPEHIKSIPVVIMTIQSNFNYLKKTYDLPICGHMTKPVNAESVQTILSNLRPKQAQSAPAEKSPAGNHDEHSPHPPPKSAAR